MTTAAEIQGWVEGTRPTDWYGKCAGLTERVVAVFTRGGRLWYDSATEAREASGWLNPDPGACPPGGIHYWSYYGKAWDGSYGNWGHVTIDMYGGGWATLSATGHAFEDWGVHAGLISVESQSARAGMRYLGWASTYGDAAPLIITNLSTAGGDARPFEEEDMTPDQSADLKTVADFVRKFEAVVKPFDGVPGVDLSTPRILQAVEASIDTNHRIIYRDANGTPTYDLAQLTANEIKPMLLTLLGAIGRPTSDGPTVPIDVAALAAAIREGLGEDLVAALAKQLSR